ncbi:MAG: sensor histidine kinase, partial [Burkholderiaceae bacterium]
MSTSTSSEAAELHRRLITARAPPSALLDGMDRLLHLDAAATCYLAPSADGIESVRSAAGAAADALPWLHAGLAEPVAAALTSARRYRRLIETEALVLPPDIGEGYLVVGAEPLSAGRDDETIQDPGLVQDPGLMLIWFHRRDGGSWPAGANTKDTYRELDRWLMALGHDLKNPLNLALLNAEILARRADLRHHAAVLRATEAIRGAILVQAAIINDLLELSRAHAGLITLRLVPADLRRSLQAIGAMLH